MLVITAALLSGCATGPLTSAMPSYDPNKPQVFLPGADLEQAKGVAMGSAVSKGWRVAGESDNVLVLERELNEAVAESVAPGASLATTPPRVQVKSDFFPRDGGVDVVVSADVVSSDGEGGEKRQDYTEAYRPDLERSLTSLRATWSKSRGRVASATPPLPDSSEAPPQADPDVPLAPIAESEPQVSGTEPAAQPGTAWGGSGTAVAAPVIDATGSSPGTGTQAGIAPDSPAPSATPSALPPAPQPSDPLPDSANMMALNQPAATGVWAYYAEHYARVRGCTLAGDGAVLVDKQPDYEMHRVYCEGGQTFLVRCNAGICRGMR
jgi:hypothetical protein